MRSRHHLPMSVLVGLAWLPVLSVPPARGVAVVAAAGLLGTLIDLDHFPIARLRTGSWAPLWRCLRDPRLALVRQDRIFPDGAVGPGERLASHLTIGGVLIAGLLMAGLVRPAAVAGTVLGVHVLADVWWDARRRV